MSLDQYVNDRPYVASSFLSVAIARVFRTALAGRCDERPELVGTPIPLQAHLAVLPCQGGEELLRRLFQPLGYTVKAEQHPLDDQLGWSKSDYFSVTLEAVCCLSALLRHLYVLIPVLDDKKHYWIGEEEVAKLLRYGSEWLVSHPEKELIAERYLKHQESLLSQALSRLLEDQGAEALTAPEAKEVEDCPGLNEQRLDAVVEVLKGVGAQRVLDLGCGEGSLLERLLREDLFKEIVGLDVSLQALERARRRLRLDHLPPGQRERLQLRQSSLVYFDPSLQGYDAAAVLEVIEHLEPPWQLAAFERVLFECARPKTIVITTPNAEYNSIFGLMGGEFRHPDHRFEWTRKEFRSWAEAVAARSGYEVTFLPIGPEDPLVGPPTQMGVFSHVCEDHSP
jgi:3' terminal RNA ribose 2'-O-methyltransferase Hen1